MKFTVKLIISITAIISIIFSIAGISMIKSNFKNSLEKSISQNIDAHLVERYGIENNIVNNIGESGEISKDKLIEYARAFTSYVQKSKKISIFFENEKIYTNIENDANIEKKENEVSYELMEIDGIKYIFVCSTLEINNTKITLLSRYNINDVFEENNRQLISFFKTDIAVILVSSIAICILSIFLTKPIVILNETSKKITKGLFSERINIKTNDEIGELAQSFNIMIETIENKIAELKLSVKQKEEFITNFTHELKNPMTSIIGYSDLLRNDKYTKEQKNKAANYIFSEAKRLETLAHKLMDLMGLSEENIKFEKIDINNFIKQINENINDNLENIELECKIEKGTVIGDRILLEDLIRNLIDNSKKAEPKDNKIVILGENQKDKYKISIIDKGCGISKEDLPRIIESFYIVDKARAKTNGSTGIGLALCEKIVNLHGSKLEFKSKLGEGTTVTFYLEVVKNEI